MNARDAAVVLSFGGLGLFMCGRFAGSWIMQRIRAERVLLCCVLGTVMATFLIVCNLGKISLIALFLVYVFEAIMFPHYFCHIFEGIGWKDQTGFFLPYDVSRRRGCWSCADGLCGR